MFGFITTFIKINYLPLPIHHVIFQNKSGITGMFDKELFLDQNFDRPI